jgi:uncharacterized protein YqcC (DUF446 family)
VSDDTLYLRTWLQGVLVSNMTHVLRNSSNCVQAAPSDRAAAARLAALDSELGKLKEEQHAITEQVCTACTAQTTCCCCPPGFI